MITLSLLGRGGQGIKSAAHIVSTAAFLGGYYVQDQPLYGAERRGAPISAFIRIAEEPILMRGQISNPDFIVIADDSLLQSETNRLGETKDAIIFVNTTMTAEKLASKYQLSGRIITYDLTTLALNILGKPMVSVAVAGVATKILNLNFEDVKQSVGLELKEIGIHDADLAKNIELARAGFESVPHVKIEATKEYEEKEYGIFQLKYHEPNISTCTIVSPGNSNIRRTGDWSIYKPVIDFDKCTKCMICFVYCPDSAITIDKKGYPVVDLNACKGCDICCTECPPRAITLARRVAE
jgi:pyruvate ferredoxin oxidoreductase gamma subunit